jgi:hypothetical protein
VTNNRRVWFYEGARTSAIFLIEIIIIRNCLVRSRYAAFRLTETWPHHIAVVYFSFTVAIQPLYSTAAKCCFFKSATPLKKFRFDLAVELFFNPRTSHHGPRLRSTKAVVEILSED